MTLSEAGGTSDVLQPLASPMKASHDHLGFVALSTL